jgi:putative exosortase-associated protein (TIGR04073 family)
LKSLLQKLNKSQLLFYKTIIAIAVILCSVATPERAIADRYKTPDSATPQEVADGVSTKLMRGLANVATGWVELPKQIYYTTHEDGWAKGVFVGPFKGIIMMLVRTGSGLGEVVSFPVPYPGFYEPYFDPAYVWQKE